MPETTHELLGEIVSRIQYRPGWRVGLAEKSDGVLELQIIAKGYDTYHPENGDNYRLCHPFMVPSATYNEESWTRWLFDRFVDVETHEASEFFVIKSGYGDPSHLDRRPFAPNHGPGWNPYVVRELNTVTATETTAEGERREGTQG